MRQRKLLQHYTTPYIMTLGLLFFSAISLASAGIASRGMSNSLFDYIVNLQGSGSASVFTLMYGVLPVFALVLPLCMDRFESEMIVVRMHDRRQLLYVHLLFAWCASLVVTCLMMLIGVGMAWIKQGELINLWGSKEGMLYFLLQDKATFPTYLAHVTTMKVWTYVILSRLLVTFFIALSVILLKLLVKKSTYVLFIMLFLSSIDGRLWNDVYVLIGRVNISVELWVKPEDQLFNLIYFLLGIVVVGYLAMKKQEKKEFYT